MVSLEKRSISTNGIFESMPYISLEVLEGLALGLDFGLNANMT